MHAAESSDVIKSLCSLFIRTSESGKLLHSYSRTYATLSSTAFGSNDYNEIEIIEKIKRRLERNDRRHDALLVEDICQRLRRSYCITNRAEILQFLLSLNHIFKKSSSSSPSSSAGGVDVPELLPQSHVMSSRAFKAPMDHMNGLASNDRLDHHEYMNGLGGEHPSSSTKDRFTAVVPHPSDSNSPGSVFSSDVATPTTSSGLIVPRKLSVNAPTPPASGNQRSSPTIKPSSLSGLRFPSNNFSKPSSLHRVSGSNPGQGMGLSNNGGKLCGRNAYIPKPSENSLIRDMLYVLQGIDGQYVRYVSKEGRHVVDESVDVSRPQQSILLKLSECGWLYLKIQRFCDSKLSSVAGLIKESLCSALRSDLLEYYHMLALLQSQMDQCDDQGVSPGAEPGSMSLRRLLCWTYKHKAHLKLLARLADTCEDVRGGELISMVAAHHRHGDPDSIRILRRVLGAVCRPLHALLVRWLYDGLLDDPYDEFFIHADASVCIENLWTRKYTIRNNMLPSFISQEQASKILLVGKSINFLRAVCKVRERIDGLEKLKLKHHAVDASFLFELTESLSLDIIVDDTYSEISHYLLKFFDEQLMLQHHLLTLKKYILLSQGDFARHLMDLLNEEMANAQTQVHMHNLTAILDTALRQTQPSTSAGPAARGGLDDVLSRIDVVPVQNCLTTNKSWDHFVLRYNITGPLETIFNHDSMQLYHRLFKFIWRVKRLDFILSEIWSNHMAQTRGMEAVIPELHCLFHTACIITKEMLHFIQQLQYYLAHEVLECCWADLMAALSTSRDLDDCIAAHGRFVQTVFRRSLLDEDSEDIQQQMYLAFDLILEFESLVTKFYDDVIDESERRENMEDSVLLLRQLEPEEIHERKKFVDDVLATYQPRLRLIFDNFREHIQRFLVSLTSTGDEQLACMVFRIDFSQFYQLANQELDASLTNRRFSKRYDRKQPRAGSQARE